MTNSHACDKQIYSLEYKICIAISVFSTKIHKHYFPKLLKLVLSYPTLQLVMLSIYVIGRATCHCSYSIFGSPHILVVSQYVPVIRHVRQHPGSQARSYTKRHSQRSVTPYPYCSPPTSSFFLPHSHSLTGCHSYIDNQSL